MPECPHRWEPYPAAMIVVTEEQALAEPLRMDWAPPRIVPCLDCGAPIDRGRYTRIMSHPWAGPHA